MNVEIRTEASQFPEKEYINGIFVAVCSWKKILQDVFSGIHLQFSTATPSLKYLYLIFILKITLCGEGVGVEGSSKSVLRHCQAIPRKNLGMVRGGLQTDTHSR